jgi:hypothetical protein
MPFDPDKFLQKYSEPKAAEAGGFDPDAFLSKYEIPAENPNSRSDMAALEGFGQGAAMGYLPQLQSAAEPLTNKIFAMAEGKPEPELPGYTERRDENIRRQSRLSQESPGAYGAGLIGGTIASGAGLAKAVPMAGMSVGKQAVASGALAGALQNPGDTQGEIQPLQAGERLAGAGLGGALGGATQKVLGAAAKAAPALKNFAQEKAFKSSGAMLKDFRKAFARDRVGELGQSMLDNGLVKPGMTYDDVAARSMDLKKQAGKELGNLYNSIKSVVRENPQLLETELSSVNPDKFKEALTKVVQDPKLRPKIGTAKYDDQMNVLVSDILGENRAKEIVAEKLAANPEVQALKLKGIRGDIAADEMYRTLESNLIKQTQHANLADVTNLNDMIGEIDTRINWSKRVPELTDQQQGLVALRQFLRNKVNEVSDQIEKSANLLGDTKASDLFKKLNKQYGNMAEISRIAGDQVQRQSANRFFSPSDYGAAGVGAIVGASQGDSLEGKLKGAALGAGAGAANRVMRRYLNPLVATGASKASQAIESSGAQKVLQNAASKPAMTGNVVGGGVGRVKSENKKGKK